MFGSVLCVCVSSDLWSCCCCGSKSLNVVVLSNFGFDVVWFTVVVFVVFVR